MRWNIDAKHDSAVEPLIETLRRADAVDRVCVTSFSDRRLTRIRRALGPGLCTAMGPAAVSSLRVASLLPPALADAGRGARSAGSGRPRCRSGRGGCRSSTGASWPTAHRAGLQVHVWTVDDEMHHGPPARPRSRRHHDRPAPRPQGVLERRGQSPGANTAAVAVESELPVLRTPPE